MPLHAELDHLVIAAQTLEQGVAWCEATLGATPAPGGKHALMGTHNRLLSIAGPKFEQAYLEIIAIDPEAVPPRHARWFGLDEPSLQQALCEGPRLVHFAARVPDLAAACVAWAALDLQPGTAVVVSRDTPRGRLEWLITVRKDGRPQHHGALPTLIQWGEQLCAGPPQAQLQPPRGAERGRRTGPADCASPREGLGLASPNAACKAVAVGGDRGSTFIHPAQSLPDSGVSLRSMSVSAPRREPLMRAFVSIGLAGVSVTQGPPGLQALLRGPRGDVILPGGFGP